jgi:hypothetical protein
MQISGKINYINTSVKIRIREYNIKNINTNYLYFLFKKLKDMTSFLYISYSSGFSEQDKFNIDKSVFKNRLAVRKFFKKIRVDRKLIVISTALGMMILFSKMENVDAMGLTHMPKASIMRLDNQIVSNKFVPSKVRLDTKK